MLQKYEHNLLKLATMLNLTHCLRIEVKYILNMSDDSFAMVYCTWPHSHM